MEHDSATLRSRGTRRRRTVGIAFAIAACASVLGSGASPAGAWTDPLTACNSNAAPTRVETVTTTTATPITTWVQPGEVVRIRYVSGFVKIGNWWWDPVYRPDGSGIGVFSSISPRNATGGNFMMTGVPEYGLIGHWNGGYWGDAGTFYMGTNNACYRNWSFLTWQPRTMSLGMWINDGNPWDNSFGWTLQIERFE